MMRKLMSVALATVFATSLGFSLSVLSANAQDRFPEDDNLVGYHQSPKYRESESHPLRIVGYVLHPIGWVVREVLFRPFSYFASSTETSRAVLGYREPYDFRQPSCFSSDDSTPNCHKYPPFTYNGEEAAPAEEVAAVVGAVAAERQVYFPDVNFDFNSRQLTQLGEGRTRQIAALLKQEGGMKIVLEGHTDFKGADGYNEKLGMDRAEVVREKLVALGVSADQLSTLSFGKSKPVLAEQEDWARAVNRRVTLQVAGSAGEASDAQ